MTIYTVLLASGTIGKIDSDCIDGQSACDFIGEEVNVHFHDKNGCDSEERGKLIEVLDESEY
jgi:hypothetical protein